MALRSLGTIGFLAIRVGRGDLFGGSRLLGFRVWVWGLLLGGGVRGGIVHGATDPDGKDKPTDVLAFAQREAASADAALLGDLVISIDTAKRQAKRGLYKELLHLASHGLCHLLGYDHNDAAEEATMNARAAALRREAGRSGRVRAA